MIKIRTVERPVTYYADSWGPANARTEPGYPVISQTPDQSLLLGYAVCVSRVRKPYIWWLVRQDGRVTAECFGHEHLMDSIQQNWVWEA